MLRPARYRCGWWNMPVAHFHFLRCPAHMLDVQRRLRQGKLLAAARLADYLVVDCSFADESHVSLEHYHARLHLKIHSCFTSLYRYHSPSFLLLCNAPSRDKTAWLYNSPYCHATSFTYLDLFARERLVYLSPDSPNVMSEYDHNAVYILGGLFQRSKWCVLEKSLICASLDLQRKMNGSLWTKPNMNTSGINRCLCSSI